MNASHQDPVNIKEWFYATRTFFLKQFPLRFSETKIMMTMMTGDAIAGNIAQFIELRHRRNHQRRKQLLQDVAVLFQQQAEKFLYIVSHQINFQSVADLRHLDCLATRIQTD